MVLDVVVFLVVKCFKGVKSQVLVIVYDVGLDLEEVIDVCIVVMIFLIVGDQDLGIIKNIGVVIMYIEELLYDFRFQWDDIFEILDQDSNGIINGDEVVLFF